MTDLTGLIERLKKATASRVLDSEIRLAALGDTQYGWKRDPHDTFGKVSALLSEYLTRFRDVIDADDDLQEEVVPRYTSSIDAALTLVPEGRYWRIHYRYTGDDGRWFGACVGTDSNYVECKSTPAIALCIAALKARATERKE